MDGLKATERQGFELADLVRRCVRTMCRRLDCHFATKTYLCMLMAYPGEPNHGPARAAELADRT